MLSPQRRDSVRATRRGSFHASLHCADRLLRHCRRLFRHRRADRYARTAFRRAGPSERDVGLDEADGVGAEPCRQPARQDQRRMGAREVQGIRLGRAYRGIPGSLSDAAQAKRSSFSARRSSRRRCRKSRFPATPAPRAKDKPLPAYLEYQGDGDVTAPLVYVNYGMQDDYKALERMGVSVKGKIVIARYGAGWRGLKPRLAADAWRGRLHHLFRSRR